MKEKKKNTIRHFAYLCCKKMLEVSPFAVRMLASKLKFMRTGMIFTTDRRIFFKLLPAHNAMAAHWWQKQTSWQAKTSTPKRYEKLTQYIADAFAPSLSESFTVCDLACACGDFAFQIAGKVKQVEAFDLSEDMINTAKEAAAKMGIKNVDFRQADAEQLQLPANRYDAFMMLGLLTCIDIPNAAAIVSKVSCAMKPQAKLIIKDSLTHHKTTEYAYNKSDASYVAYYRTEQEYVSLFESNGFKLLHATYLEGNRKSFAAIFEKV